MGKSYLPLRAQTSSDFPEDLQLSDDSRSCLLTWKNSIIIFLFITNIVTFIYRAPTPNAKEQIPEDYAIVETLPTAWTPLRWWSPYGSHNHTRDDVFWEAINPSHGFVAIDRQEAAERHWPTAMYLPSDESKGVYLLEAYHLLHCLKAVRSAFWEAVENKDYTRQPPAHLEHCFDTIRQSIMCHADNNPLYTFGDNTAGDGQLRRCHNWDALRNYATENSACYRDTESPVLLQEHFGYCDGGIDGLQWPDDAVSY